MAAITNFMAAPSASPASTSSSPGSRASSPPGSPRVGFAAPPRPPLLGVPRLTYDTVGLPPGPCTVAAAGRWRRHAVGGFLRKFRGVDLPAEAVDEWLAEARAAVRPVASYPGSGNPPRAGDRLTAHVRITTLAPGGGVVTALDSRADAAGVAQAGRAMEWVLGDRTVIPGLELAVAQMRQGETADFVVPPELAYGYGGFGAAIPPHAALYCHVDLLRIEAPE